jgi:hypothetical protein
MQLGGDTSPLLGVYHTLSYVVGKTQLETENEMKLTVDTLDNEVKSAVINIGTDGGYIEAFIDNSFVNPQLCINFYNSGGTVFSREVMPLSMFTTRSK